MAQTTVFNLIILDESGSMTPLKQATVSGCNETLSTIRSQQKEHGDSQRYLVSIYVFQSENPQSPSRYLVKNKPIGEVQDLKSDDYEPWGSTPLLDAIGSTVVDLDAVAATHEDALGVVTVITDGYENSSRRYSLNQVARLIAAHKEMGWLFNFIGANVDVERVSQSLNIDNAMCFHASAEGTSAMYSELNDCISIWDNARVKEEQCLDDSEARLFRRKERNRGFFGM